jgi:hypothetical protein
MKVIALAALLLAATAQAQQHRCINGEGKL